MTNGGNLAPSCSFDPSSVSISDPNSATSLLTMSTSGSTLGGNYAISVTGSDANTAPPSNGPQALTLDNSANRSAPVTRSLRRSVEPRFGYLGQYVHFYRHGGSGKWLYRQREPFMQRDQRWQPDSQLFLQPVFGLD